MICEHVSKMGLLLFWRCMSSQEQQKFIEKERLNKLKTDNIQTIVKKTENYEDKYKKAIDAVTLLNRDIQDGLSFEETKMLLKELEEYLRCMT